ncbi:MAG: hypothetical protein ACXWD5_12345 [Mycobacterium sp.]
MSKMRAARMHGYKQPLRLEENSDPRYRARRIVGFKGRPTVR